MLIFYRHIICKKSHTRLLLLLKFEGLCLEFKQSIAVELPPAILWGSWGENWKCGKIISPNTIMIKCNSFIGKIPRGFGKFLFEKRPVARNVCWFPSWECSSATIAQKFKTICLKGCDFKAVTYSPNSSHLWLLFYRTKWRKLRPVSCTPGVPGDQVYYQQNKII